MTVEQLICILKKMPQEANAFIRLTFDDHKLLFPINSVNNTGSTVLFSDEVAQ